LESSRKRRKRRRHLPSHGRESEIGEELAADLLVTSVFEIVL